MCTIETGVKLGLVGQWGLRFFVRKQNIVATFVR